MNNSWLPLLLVRRRAHRTFPGNRYLDRATGEGPDRVLEEIL